MERIGIDSSVSRSIALMLMEPQNIVESFSTCAGKTERILILQRTDAICLIEDWSSCRVCYWGLAHAQGNKAHGEEQRRHL